MNPMDNIRRDNRCPSRDTVQKRIILSQVRDRGVLSRAKCETEAYYLSQRRDSGVFS